MVFDRAGSRLRCRLGRVRPPAVVNEVFRLVQGQGSTIPRSADREVTGMANDLKKRLTSRTGAQDGNGCLPWVGGLRSNGYGTFAVKRDGKWTQTTAHRIAYQVFVGEIPNEHEVDHLCGNRRCVNPDHLEAVTLQENRRRRNENKTHCKHGHAYTEANTRIQHGADGYDCRVCRTCENARHRLNYRKVA